MHGETKCIEYGITRECGAEKINNKKRKVLKKERPRMKDKVKNSVFF